MSEKVTVKVDGAAGQYLLRAVALGDRYQDLILYFLGLLPELFGSGNGRKERIGRRLHHRVEVRKKIF